MLWMVFWGSLGLVLGAFGGFLEAPLVLLRVRGGTLNSQNFLFGSLEPPSWPPRSLQQPQAAPQAPSWRGKWPHEATKAHLETYLDLFSIDFGPEIKEKKKARGIVTALSKRLSALLVSILSSQADPPTLKISETLRKTLVFVNTAIFRNMLQQLSPRSKK